MSPVVESQSAQQNLAESSKDKEFASEEAGASASPAQKKGRSLLHVPSRSPSQKIQPSPTSTGLSGATASDSRESIDGKSRESKSSFAGRPQQNGSTSSRHSANGTDPTNTPVNSQPSSPAAAPSPKRKKGGGFLAIFGCCSAPDDANALDGDDPPLPASKLKDIPPRPATATRRTGVPSDHAASGGVTELSEKDEPEEESKQLEEKYQSQPQPQYPSQPLQQLAPPLAGSSSANASSAGAKRNSETPTLDNNTPTTASTAVASTSNRETDSKRASLAGSGSVAPTLAVEPPLHGEATTTQTADRDAVEAAPRLSEDDDAEMPDADAIAASSQHMDADILTQATEVLPSVPPPPPGPAPASSSAAADSTAMTALEPAMEYQQPTALLPPIEPRLKGRKCLVLDLDETLVHSSFKVRALPLHMASPPSPSQDPSHRLTNRRHCTRPTLPYRSRSKAATTTST